MDNLRWRRLYAKLRADLAASLASGGGTIALLYVLGAMGIETSPEAKAILTAAAGYIGGKIAAWIRPETGPKVT